MDFFDVVQQRQSCRAYRNQAVEPEKIEACLKAAQLAPSACNSQPWHYIVVQAGTQREAIASALTDPALPLNRFARDVPAFIVVVEEPANLAAMLGGKVKGQEYAPLDIGLSVAQLTLAATSLGLAHCLLGWFSEKKLKRALWIKGRRKVRLVIALGYAQDAKVRPKKRKGLQEMVSYNAYKRDPDTKGDEA